MKFVPASVELTFPVDIYTEKTVEVPEELLANPEVKKAVKAVEESAFTPAQLLGYEKFWDIISVEKTLYYSAEQKGMKRGMEKGMEEGMEKGMEEGMEKGMEKGKAEEKERLEIPEQLLHEPQPEGRGRQDGCHHWTG